MIELNKRMIDWINDCDIEKTLERQNYINEIGEALGFEIAYESNTIDINLDILDEVLSENFNPSDVAIKCLESLENITTIGKEMADTYIQLVSQNQLSI